MSGTPTVAAQILGRLTSDSALMALLTGGVYDRPIKRGQTDGAGRVTPPGATPQAFASVAPFQPRPAAVIVDGIDESDPFGPAAAYWSFPMIYLYAPPTTSGKETIANAWDLMHSRLHNWRFGAANGMGALVSVVGRIGIIDDPEDDKRVLGGMRLQVSGIWRKVD